MNQPEIFLALAIDKNLTAIITRTIVQTIFFNLLKTRNHEK
jgi:hypothetical protein